MLYPQPQNSHLTTLSHSPTNESASQNLPLADARRRRHCPVWVARLPGWGAGLLLLLLLASSQASARYHHYWRYHHYRHYSYASDSTPESDSSEVLNSRAAHQVRKMTGRHTRMVWVQTTTDICGKMHGLYRLMGLDTDDGRAIRVIIPKLGGCIKPMITPAGDQVVFTNLYDESMIYIVNFDGTGLRRLRHGYAVFLWRDPNTGIDWVYARARNGSIHDPIIRFRLDQPHVTEMIWDKTSVGQETYCWFRVSADGRRAGAAFPWPNCGEATLPNGQWQQWGSGCWTSMAPDNSYRYFHFDGSHKHIIMYDDGGQNRRMIYVNHAPGEDGKQVLYPDWSNDVRFMVLTGPAEDGTHTEGEVEFGQFDSDFTRIAKWVRVTHNESNDIWPNAWIAPRAGQQMAPGRSVMQAQAASYSLKVNDPATIHRLALRARLIGVSKTPTYQRIAPYSRALVVYEYRVERVLEGAYTGRTIRVAHWGMLDKKPTPINHYTPGSSYYLKLEAFTDHPQLESEYLSDTLPPDDSLPLYYEPPA